MYDLVNFTVGDMVDCSTELRRATAGAPDLTAAAHALAHHLHHNFRDPVDGSPQIALTLLFRTTPDGTVTRLAASGAPDPDTLHPTETTHTLGPFGINAAHTLTTEHDPWEIHLVPDARNPYAIPDQQFVHRHNIRAVLAYTCCGSPDDHTRFTVLLHTHTPVPDSALDQFHTLAAATRLALTPTPGDQGHVAALEQLLKAQETTSIQLARAAEDYRNRNRTQTEQLRFRQHRLEQETRIVETLYRSGHELTRELDLERLIQTATDAATSVIAAETGVFHYTEPDPEPDALPTTHTPIPSCTVSGIHADLHSGSTTPTPTAPHTVVRTGDLTTHPDHHHLTAYLPQPAPAPFPAAPVRSFLALPVTTRSGDLLGTMAFAHSRSHVFTPRDEQIARGIAAQAAAAIDNARLYRRVTDTAIELQRSLLPSPPPVLDELDVAYRYLPGAKGEQVGGDWFDVIPLSAGRIALVIGDVMGRGLKAAAVMGQLRTAVRAYAVMDLPPAQLMRHLNRLALGLDNGQDRITTCVYAVYDPGSATVRWANAGHPPPALMFADGDVLLLDDDLGVPLGLDGTTFEDAYVPFHPGDRLLLYTDGLVERHDASLTDRLRKLTAHLDGAGTDVQAVCTELVTSMLTGDEHDDVALLLVRARSSVELTACLELPASTRSAREARVFAARTLERWNLSRHLDTVCSIATELVSNAVEHARTPMELQLRHHPGRLVVQVADHDGRMPRETPASLLDERHRGLAIVGVLAADWGVRPTDSGKTVWAEIADG